MLQAGFDNETKFVHTPKPSKAKLSATALARRRDTSCGITVWHYHRLITTVVYYRHFTIIYYRRLLPSVRRLLQSFTTVVYCRRSVTVHVLLSVC